jgi:hypothetical protein
MPMHRRRVYLDHGSSRKARIEGWLSLSIFLSAVLLILSLLGCSPDLLSSVRTWFLAERPPVPGLTSRTDSSVLAVPCEILMTISGAYLAFALFLKSHTSQRPH